MSIEQWVALLTVAATLLVAGAGVVKVTVDAIVALRRKSGPEEPAPQVGIPAAPDDIDYRAFKQMVDDRDWWRARATELERRWTDEEDR